MKTLNAIGFVALALSAFTGCLNRTSGEVDKAGKYEASFSSTDPEAMLAQVSANKQNEMLAAAYAEAIRTGRMPFGQGGIGATTDMYYCPDGNCPQMPAIEQPAQPAAAPAPTPAPAQGAAPAATPQASATDSNAEAMAIAKQALEQSNDAIRANLELTAP